MSPVRAADQELVVHLFARADGPYAVAAYDELREVWHRCRDVLGMTAPLSRSGLPVTLPPTLDDLPRDSGGGELVVAAQQHPSMLYQAILRRFPTMINLSAVLSPSPQAGAPGWRELDQLWRSAAGPWSGQLIGAAYLFLGKSGPLTVDDPELAQQVAADLPRIESPGWWHNGMMTAGGFALWEPGLHGSDGRTERQFLILALPDRDDQLSDWTWSNGEAVLPPLGHHLRHAAAVRHQVCVWQEADDMRRVQHQLDTVGPEELPRIRADLAYWRAALREMRQSMKNTEAAMRAALGPDASAAAGPIADDLALVAWLRGGLKDDLANLTIADDRARALSQLSGETAPMPNSRDVFVIHGRDDQARRALWSFLQAIDLHPLDWEEVVQETGGPSPYMGEVLAKAFEHNQAAVVLMTPDDGAMLHESLRDKGDASFESELTGQPRPNVLVEAGMALGLQRDRTVIIQVGRLRPISDLAGINTIHFNGTVPSLQKIAQRLKAAGCAVNTTGIDWLDVSRFKDLATYDRTF
ncbi:CATRA conflict system CASPASE/TPR repeat-associated protein [Micromonospora sp. NPDC005173]|uniref:CATRA conflict system CASPASE/TPR repeat-associated protein n=1 Tax=Micromonospora sp. NPDC005173 TaxID=3157165 RepID=UPI0033AB793A